MNQALGIIEVVGFGCAVNVSDVMVKTANVKIVGMERAKGSGWLTIKALGDVGAVNAAVESGSAAAKADGKLVTSRVIPRLGEGLDIWLKKGLDASTDKPETLQPLEIPHPVEVAPVTEEMDDVESDVSVEKKLETDTEEDMLTNDVYTCNICKDPACTRSKGEPRRECLHHETLK